MSGEHHVFIVGLPRTGTTLTRAILNTSPLVAIGGESKFLPGRARWGTGMGDSYRASLLLNADLETESGISTVAARLYDHAHTGYWRTLAEALPRTEFESRLRGSDRTDRAVFALAMDHFSSGRPIRGDKSPQHLHWVPLLLQWFPDARIIHTFRDPRAVFVSLQQKGARGSASRRRHAFVNALPVQAYAAASLAVRWRRAVTLHRQYETRYQSQYMLLRFEDLIQQPDASIRRLCAHVGIDFSQGMLDQAVINSSFLPRGSARGIDSTVLERWRNHISPFATRLILTLCGAKMKDFGYEP